MAVSHKRSRSTFRRADDLAVALSLSDAPVPYPFAVAEMEERARAIAAGEAREWIWLLEHPPLYSAGVSAKSADLLTPDRFPVFASGRGGQFTYHGPGQRVAYVMLDLRARGQDVRAFVASLESWLIAALGHFGIAAETRADRVGVWVERPPPALPGAEDKIAAIGVKLRRWVSFHGVSLNVAPDLEHFTGIIPCGISNHGVTSLLAMGVQTSMGEVDRVLIETFETIFGPWTREDAPRS